MLYTPFIRAIVGALAHGNSFTVVPGSAEAAALKEALVVLDGQAATLVNSANAVAAANALAEKYRSALAWYADPSIYLTVDPATQIAADKGARARDVITEKGN